MSVYCTLPRGGGSYYHSSMHSPPESGSGSGSSPSSSSSTITSDSSSMLSRQGTIGNHHSVNPRYQHLQSIKTMFNNVKQQASSSSLNDKSSNNEDTNSLINNQSVNYQQQQQQSLPYQHDYQDYHGKLHEKNELVLPSLKNYSAIDLPVTPGLPSPQNNQFNQLTMGLNGLNLCNNDNGTTSSNSLMNPNQSQYQQQQRQSLQLTIPRPPEPPQRIYYGLNNFDDLKTIRRNSITSLVEDPPTPNFYGDEDSAYDSTSNESLRLTVKELSKRSNSKKYFTLPTKLGRRLRKSSCPEFNKDTTNNHNQSNQGTDSLTPSPVSDCSPSSKLIFNGSAFPPSVPSKATLLTSSSIISSSSSSSSSPTSSISPPSIVTSPTSSPSSSSPTSSTDVSVSSPVSQPPTLVTEMSSSPQQLHLNYTHIDNCVNHPNNQRSSLSTPTSETMNSLPFMTNSPSANESICHCCYLLGCHNNNQSLSITQSNSTAHQQQQHQHVRVNPGGVSINANPVSNNISSTGQPSTLETLWEEPSSGHESVRLTEEAIYAAMRELNISLPSKDSVNGQANRNSSSWLRANFLKAFRRSSKNRSSKIITNNNVNNSNSSNGYQEDDKSYASSSSSSSSSSTIGSRRGSLIMNQDQNNFHSHHQQQQQFHDNHQQSSSCYSDEISSKRTSSGPSVASSLVSLPLSCSSSVPPTPPLTPLPSYHSYQHQHQHQSQLQLQILENQQQQNQTLTTSHHVVGTDEEVIKELNRQLAEKDQLLQEVCMESINHLNTIESLKELVTQLREEIDSLKNQNDQQNAKYSSNSMDKIKTDFNEYRSNQMQVNQLTNRNCA